jgi:hypothetical protein
MDTKVLRKDRRRDRRSDGDHSYNFFPALLKGIKKLTACVNYPGVWQEAKVLGVLFWYLAYLQILL